MAGFGFAKPRAVSVGAGDIPRPQDLSMRDKILMLSAALQGDQQTLQSIPLLAAAKQRQADERTWRTDLARDLQGVPMRRQAAVKNDEGEDITQAFGPEIETVRGPRPTLRDLAPRLLEGRGRGYDIKDEIELLKATDPEYKYERGVRYDPRDPNAPKEIADVDKGQVRLYDANDKFVGVMNANGYVQSVAELERAKAQATEGAKAEFDVGKYDLPDGSTQQLTRAEAVSRLSGGVPRVGGGTVDLPQPTGRSPAPTAGFGRSQTPAEAELAKQRAATQADIEKLTPKAKSALETLDRKTKFVLDTLRKAKEQTSGGLGGSAGVNALLSGIPETKAYNLDATIDTIEAAIGFDELQQMRDNSPTGGAVGNLTERELALLSSLRGSLKQGQSPEQLRGNIDRAISELEKISSERQAAFRRQYGEGRSATGARTPSLAEIDAALARKGAR